MKMVLCVSAVVFFEQAFLQLVIWHLVLILIRFITINAIIISALLMYKLNKRVGKELYSCNSSMNFAGACTN